MRHNCLKRSAKMKAVKALKAIFYYYLYIFIFLYTFTQKCLHCFQNPMVERKVPSLILRDAFTLVIQIKILAIQMDNE